MFKTTLLIITLITSLNSHAATLLPQAESTGEDGTFSTSADRVLLIDTDNIYNFTDFSVTNAATLSIFANSPVYIYSQQSMLIDGSIFAENIDLTLVAPEITFINGTINTNNIAFYSNSTLSTSNSINIDNGAILSNNNTGTISIGSIDLTSNTNNNLIITSSDTILINSGTITLTPVPLPAAIWLMLSGLLSLGLISRHRKH